MQQQSFALNKTNINKNKKCTIHGRNWKLSTLFAAANNNVIVLKPENM